MIQHNSKTWDITITGFEDSTVFVGNTIGTFKVQSSMIKRFNDFANATDKERAFNAIADTFIHGLINTAKSKVLKTIPFDALEDDTRYYLQQAAYGAIQHAILNRTIWEQLNTSGITTPNFTINSDSTNWLLQEDKFGSFVKDAIANSGIAEYEWVTEDYLYTATGNGNVKVIARADLEQIKKINI